MPRLPLLNTRSSVAPEDQPVFDAIIESRGVVTTPIALLMHAPRAAQQGANLGAYLRFEAGIPADIFELAIVTAAREFDCEFIWAAHAPLAVREGIPQGLVDAIGRRSATGDYAPRLHTVVQFTREIVRVHRVAQETFEAIRTEFGERGLTDLTALIGFYLMLACTLFVNDMELPPGSMGFPTSEKG